MRRVEMILLAIGLLMPAMAWAQEKKPIPKVNLSQAAMDKLGWRLGAQAYTFRALSLFETINLLSAMGIRHIEIYPGQRFSPETGDLKHDHNLPADKIDALLAKLQGANVRAVLYGVVGLPNDEAKCRAVFDYAKKLKLETIVSEPPTDAIALIDKLAAEYGINVAIHDHPQPSLYWNPEAVLAATKDAKHVAACADIGHWRRSDLVPVECLKKLAGKIISLHVKDIDDAKHDVVWGTGKVDVKACLEELHGQGGKYVFSIEYESTEGDELIANVAKSVEFFNAVATELAAK
ncbi:MAG: sugar phosphate isomerase/epimerase [Tepidisphaeraceae bacterium]